jgi:hypothetical protein
MALPRALIPYYTNLPLKIRTSLIRTYRLSPSKRTVLLFPLFYPISLIQQKKFLITFLFFRSHDVSASDCIMQTRTIMIILVTCRNVVTIRSPLLNQCSVYLFQPSISSTFVLEAFTRADPENSK